MRLLRVAFFLSAVVTPFLLAKGGGGGGDMRVHHGGLGFLFEDANGFANPSRRGETHEAALEALYTRTNLGDGSAVQSASPSFVWGNGSFGIGGFANRIATDLGSSTNKMDIVGGDLGAAFVQGHVGVGIGYQRSIDVGQTSDGNFSVAMTASGQKGTGFNLGGKWATTINNAGTEVRTGTIGVGYAFSKGSIEADYAVTDLSDSSNNYIAAGYFNLENHAFYFGSGFGYTKPLNAMMAQARVGVKFGKCDASILAGQSFAAGSNPTFGGSLRASF